MLPCYPESILPLKTHSGISFGHSAHRAHRLFMVTPPFAELGLRSTQGIALGFITRNVVRDFETSFDDLIEPNS